MSLPSRLQRALIDAHLAMETHPEHALPIQYRYAIYEAIGPTTNVVARRVRAYVAFIAAKHVLHIWTAAHRTDSMPERLLNQCEMLLAGVGDSVEARRLALDSWDRLVDLDSDSERKASEAVVAAGLAAVEAVWEGLGKDPFDGIVLDDGNSEGLLDPYHMDTAQFAADAYSGPMWTRASNSVKRREFWQWWLNDAIPLAWSLNSGTPLSE